MSRFNSRKLLKGSLLALGGLALAGGSIAWVQRLVTADPFAAYRTGNPLGGNVGVRIEDVELKHYNADKLVASSFIDRIDIRQDRQFFSLYGIRDGMLSTREGDSFEFSAPFGTYNAIDQSVAISDGARIHNADFDLKSGAFTYTSQNGMLKAPGSIQGKLYGGQAMGQNLVLDLRNRAFEMGPISWQGKPQSLPGAIQDTPVQASPTSEWRVDAKNLKGNAKTTVFSTASATDGEVLLKAPKIEIDKRTDVLTATGKVYYFSAKSNLVADKVVVYRKERRAVLTGDVVMLVKPKDQEKLELSEWQPMRPVVPDAIAAERPTAPSHGEQEQQKDLDDEVRSPKTSRKYPVVIRADKVEYWYATGARRALATGSPQARQQLAGGRWRHIWTFEARWDGEAEKLRLISQEGKSDTRIKTSLGDDLVATWFEVSTKEGEDADEYEGDDVRGTVRVDEEDVKEREGAGSSPPPSEPAPTTGGTTGTTGGTTGTTTGGSQKPPQKKPEPEKPPPPQSAKTDEIGKG